MRVWALTAVMAGTALVAHLRVLPHGAVLAAPFPAAAWMLAGLFALVEITVVHIHFRRHTHSWSMSEVPLVIGLAFLSPSGLVAARLGGSAVALVVHRRQPLIKLSFNLAMFWLETVVAVVAYRWLSAGASPVDPRGWLAAIIAVAAATILISGLAVPVAISLSERHLQPHVFQWVFLASVIATLANTSLGLLAVTILWYRPSATWLVAVVAALMLVGYGGYGSWRQRHDSLKGLHALTHVDEASSLEAVARRLLGEIRALLDAEIAVVNLSPQPSEGELGVTLRLGTNDHFDRSKADEFLQAVVAQCGHRRAAVLVSTDTTDAVAQGLLDHYEVREAMVGVMRGTHATVGSLMVGNRVDDVRSFGRHDLQLFETLTNYATVALSNSQLVDRLRNEGQQREHEALHDSLTGLPNRTLFRQRLASAIAGCPPDAKIGLMLLDLDHFKEVNDTLGHHTGDLLLRRISERLANGVRPSDVVARLGGDEFTVLLPGITGRTQAMAGAERIRETLRRPFQIGSLSLEAAASIGVAVYPDDGDTLTKMLQRADVAMYAAKLRRTGIESYDPRHDLHNPRRLELLGQLRDAVESDRLLVTYQPLVQLSTGQTVGVEALARWNHPVHGRLLPDEFIPLAEHGGAIKPLTHRVLRTALEQCKRWSASGLELYVSVNLSVRNLLDPGLPGHVQQVLAETDVPAERLRLEITESCMVVDRSLTAEVLQKLADSGVGLAIDDFGTGYSSLSSLRGLPVDEIKIDRSFVRAMATDHHDAVIVRLAVELAADFGLRVVAEGVEDACTLEHLTSLGCDVAQGHYFSEAMDSDELSDWVARRNSSTQPVHHHMRAEM